MVLAQAEFKCMIINKNISMGFNLTLPVNLSQGKTLCSLKCCKYFTSHPQYPLVGCHVDINNVLALAMMTFVNC